MAFDYGRPVATAIRLIDRFGSDYTLRKPGVMTGPPEDPVPGDPTPYTVRAVSDKKQRRDANGTLIAVWDETLLVAPGEVAPEKKDSVLIEGRWHPIEDVHIVAPGGVPVLYTIVLKA